MINTKVLIMVLGMALVTYIPRMLPTIFIGKIHFNEKVEKFLKLIPYTSMSALIFPGILTVDSERFYIGLVSGIVALVLAWKKCPVIICVIGAIVTNLIIYLIV